MFQVRLLDWRAERNGALFGYATVELDRCLVLKDVSIVASKPSGGNGRPGYWASLPEPIRGENGVPWHDARSKTDPDSRVRFSDRDIAIAFSQQVIAAIRERNRDALP